METSTNDTKITIRDATPEDIPQVNAIITHYALHTIVTFATAAIPDADLLAKYYSIKSEEAGSLPFLVAMVPSGSVVSSGSAQSPSVSNEATTTNADVLAGFVYLSPYRPDRLAYRHTAELSIYLHPLFVSQGLGKRLMDAILERARETQIREVIAVMALNVEEEEGGWWLKKWYGKWGFEEAGKLKGVGWKMGRWIDTVILQLSIARDPN